LISGVRGLTVTVVPFSLIWICMALTPVAARCP
jgi:hypothetical protein